MNVSTLRPTTPSLTNHIASAKENKESQGADEAEMHPGPATEDTADLKPGDKGYDGEKVNVKFGAPLSHKLVAAAGALGTAACVGRMLWQVAEQPTLGAKIAWGAGALAAGVAGYAAADFGSGVFHHFIDNYPKKPDIAKPGELSWNTPVIGDMAAEFQVHHHFTRDLEKVPFISNLYPSGKFMWAGLAALAAFSPNAAVTAAGTAFLGGAFLAQGSHRWTHEPNPPAIGKFLQKVGLAQSKEDHYTHHKMPWADHYCIVNGMWNPVLTRNDFWRKWEGLIYRTTGAEPNSWRDPGVKELALGEITKEEFLNRRPEDKKIFQSLVRASGEREALMPWLHGREELTENHAPK
ncbi:MAG: fatty acid desaturase CarF family protein [Vulcanimicrobiota bacterium]